MPPCTDRLAKQNLEIPRQPRFSYQVTGSRSSPIKPWMLEKMASTAWHAPKRWSARRTAVVLSVQLPNWLICSLSQLWGAGTSHWVRISRTVVRAAAQALACMEFLRSPLARLTRWGWRTFPLLLPLKNLYPVPLSFIIIQMCPFSLELPQNHESQGTVQAIVCRWIVNNVRGRSLDSCSSICICAMLALPLRWPDGAIYMGGRSSARHKHGGHTLSHPKRQLSGS